MRTDTTLSAYETNMVVLALTKLGSEFRDEARELYGFGDKADAAAAMDGDTEVQTLINRLKRN